MAIAGELTAMFIVSTVSLPIAVLETVCSKDANAAKRILSIWVYQVLALFLSLLYSILFNYC